MPRPPAGPVMCAVYDNDPTDGTRAGILLGRSERMFRPADAVRGGGS